MRVFNLVKKILVAVILAIGMILVLTVAVLSTMSGKIGDRAVNAVRASISSDLEVGKTSISMWTYFPNAAIKLTDVVLTGQLQDTLVVADELAFKVSLHKLFNKQVILRTVSLKNSTIHVIRYENGEWNYDIFTKDTSETSSSNAYKIAIDRAALSYCDIVYEDRLEDVTTEVFILKSSVFTSYDSGDLIIDAQGSSVLDKLRIADNELLKDIPLVFDLNLRADLPSSTYTFKKSNFKLGGIPFSLGGSIQAQDAGDAFDLNIHSERASLDNMLNLLPDHQKASLSHFRTQGYGVIDIIYAGRSTKKQHPELIINADLTNIGLTSRRYDTRLDGMNATLLIHNRNHKTHIEFENSSGILQSKPLKARAHIDLERKDSYSIDLDGSIPIALCMSILPTGDILKKASGDVECRQLVIRHGPKYKTPTSGKLQSSGMSLSLEKDKIAIDAFDINLSNDSVIIEKLECNAFKSHLHVSGQVSQVDDIISGSSWGKYNLEINSKKLNIDDILRGYTYYLESEKDTIEGSSSNSFQEMWPEVKLSFALQSISKNKLNISAIEGILNHKNKDIVGEFEGDIFDGQLSGTFTGRIDSGITLSTYLYGKGIDINKVLHQFENFDQDFVTDQHLKGKIESRMLLDLEWDNDFNFLSDRLHMSAAMIVSNGELIKLPLFQDFTTYIKVRDLEHVKFTSLHNLIEIKDSRLVIPEMLIQSNAINLRLSGEHSFDHQMDYVLQVNGGQTLINRFRRHDPSLKPLKARQKGLLNVYFRISGFPDNFQVSSDRKEVKFAMERSDAYRDNIRDRLIAAYGPLPIFFDDSMQAIDMFASEDDEDVEYLEF